MKSKIRSRWYRSSEKPLESNTSSDSAGTQAPFGEIDLSDANNLTDDLSNATPPKRSDGNERPSRERNERRSKDGRGRQPRENRNDREKKDSRKQPRGKSDGRPQGNEKKRVERRNHKDDERESTSNMKPRDGEESRGPKKRSRNRNRNKRGDRTNEANPRKNRRTDNGKKKKIPEKKGISGFLSKLFGK